MISKSSIPNSPGKGFQRTLLYFYLFGILLIGLRPIFQDNLPGAVNALLVYATILPATGGWLVVFAYKSGRRWFWDDAWRNYFSLYLLWIGFLTFLGVANGNYYKLVLLDLIPAMLFAQGFVLSTESDFWEDVRWPAVLVSFIAISIGLFNTDTIVSSDRSLIGEQAGYRAQGLIYLLPLWFTLGAFQDKRLYKACTLVLVIGAICFQLIFLKRAPFAYYFAFIGFSFILDIYRRRLASLTILFTSLFIGSVAALAYLPVNTILENLEKRLMGKTGAGVTETLTYDNTRLLELQIMLEDSKPHELFVGKGFGGVIKGLEMTEFNNYEDDDGRVLGKESTHIGYGNFVLKGGVLNLLICFIPAAYLFSRISQFGNLPVQVKTSIVYLLIQCTSFTLEGAPSVATQFLALSFGVASGSAATVKSPPIGFGKRLG